MYNYITDTKEKKKSFFNIFSSDLKKIIHYLVFLKLLCAKLKENNC